jgi:hypothetical protein
MTNPQTNIQEANSKIPAPTQAAPLRAPVNKATKETRFQHYMSALTSIQLISSKGTKIIFINHQFVTCDPDAIEYLNAEIERGLPGITMGELMTREEADPMSAIKAKWKEELRVEMVEEAKQAALGNEKDMGETDKNANINPAASKTVAGGQ